jgi:hypothetical protein
MERFEDFAISGPCDPEVLFLVPGKQGEWI